MGFVVMQVESTPNPDALVFHLDSVISDGTISIGETSGEQSDPTIAALLSIDGVAGLMFRDRFVTVRKVSSGDWGPIRAKVKRVLKDADRLAMAGF